LPTINLPQWLRIKTVEHNKLSLRLANGSQIKATAASSDAGRSEAVSLLLIDEAAFIDGIDEIFASAQQTLATGVDVSLYLHLMVLETGSIQHGLKQKQEKIHFYQLGYHGLYIQSVAKIGEMNKTLY
jgi:hypothetical protein